MITRAVLSLTILILLSLPSHAIAGCTSQTIVLPNGGILVCTTCCSFGNCVTNCV